MDLIFKRYSNPMILLGCYLSSGRLTEFVEEVVKMNNDEMENETMWDFFLHKVYDQSWADFMKEYSQIKPIEQEAANFETTIKESAKILNSFSPN